MKNRFYLLMFLLLVLSFAWQIPAQAEFTQLPNNNPTTTAPEPVKEKTIEEFKKEFKNQNKEAIVSPLTVFSNLLTLILIMLTLAWLYNKYGKKFLSKALITKNYDKNSINILSTLPIGPNKYLHIIEVDDERILIGSTNTNISLIKNLNNIEKVVSDE